MKFKTHYNAEPSKGEEKFEASQTIPDQTMPIRELMRRHAQGLPIDGARVPIWEGEDNDLPDFKTMDLAEVEAYRMCYERELQDITEAVKQKERETKEKEAQAAREAKNPRKNDSSIEDAEIIDEEPAKKEQKPNKQPKAGS